jgi:hypothetical protein
VQPVESIHAHVGKFHGLNAHDHLYLLIEFASQQGGMIPVSELGSFVYKKQDDLIFHKDLADIEYVLGEPIGRLSAPIYAMFGVDDLLLEYQTVDGKQLQGEYLGPPEDQSVPSFEWGGQSNQSLRWQ